MSTYLHGCNDIVGGDCSRYSTEPMTITRIGGYMPKGNLTHNGNAETCSLQLGQVFPSPHAMREYNERIYPVGSTHLIQYDRFTGECKTNSYVNNLAICGFTFFMLIICIWILYCTYSGVKSEYCEECCETRCQTSGNCCHKYMDQVTCGECRRSCGECCIKHWRECWLACLIRLAGSNAIVQAQSNDSFTTIVSFVKKHL